MSAKILVKRVKEDLEMSFGDMGGYFIEKRMKDLGINNEEDLDLLKAEKIISIIRTKTLPSLMNKEACTRKSQLYKKWLREARVSTGMGFDHFPI